MYFLSILSYVNLYSIMDIYVKKMDALKTDLDMIS